MERTTKIFLLDDTSKALKNQGFSEKQFQSGHSFSIQPCYDHFATAVAITLHFRIYYTTLFPSSQVIFLNNPTQSEQVVANCSDWVGPFFPVTLGIQGLQVFLLERNVSVARCKQFKIEEQNM